jgi:hypothetical protein
MLPTVAQEREPRKLVHRCPVCDTLHQVSRARAEMAYGRQLSCSPDCEGERRRRSRGHPYRIIVG